MKSFATERGSASVEFALVLPVLVLVLVAVVEVAVVGRVQLELIGAARQGARVAATHPDPVQAVEAVHQALDDGLEPDVIVTVARPAIVGRQAIVEVELHHRVLAPLFGGVPLRLSARSVMRVER